MQTRNCVMSFSSLPEHLVLEIIRKVQLNCKYSAFLLSTRLVNHQFNEAVLRVLFIEDFLVELGPRRWNWANAYSVSHDSHLTPSNGVRRSHIAQMHLQGRLLSTQLRNKRRIKDKTVLAIIRVLKDANRILKDYLRLPSFEDLRSALIKDYNLLTVSENKAFQDVETAILCRTANACLGIAWHSSPWPTRQRYTISHLTQSYAELYYDHRSTPIQLGSISPQFWVLVVACEICDESFFEHCSRPRTSRQRKVVSKLLSDYSEIFLTIAARQSRTGFLKLLLSRREIKKEPRRQPECLQHRHLPLRASILTGNRESIALLLRRTAPASESLVPMALGDNYFRHASQFIFFKTPANIVTLLDLFQEQMIILSSMAVAKLCIASYRLGDLEIMERALACLDDNNLPFNGQAINEGMLFLEGEPHVGHLRCLMLIMDGRSNNTWKKLFAPKLRVNKVNKGTILRIYARSVLQANRADLFVPVFEKYKLWKYFHGTFRDLGLAEGVEDIMQKWINESGYEILREGSSYGNCEGQMAIYSAIQELRKDNVRFLLRAGVRLVDNSQIGIRWNKYVANRNAFDDLQALLKQDGRATLRLEI